MKKIVLSILLLVTVVASTVAVNPTFVVAAKPDIVLATTTSTQDSGLLDVLIPAFERSSGYHVKVVAVGSGAAMIMGKKGDADVLLVHSPADEEQFVKDGYGIERTPVMYNDFVLVGPNADPAKIRKKTATEAFALLASSKSKFISRSDQSGTHKKELSIWKATNITPTGDWYVQAGVGMGECLTMANELGAYTLADRATFMAWAKKIDLKILVEKDKSKILLNPYTVIIVNPAKFPGNNVVGARIFAKYITTEPGRARIRSFGKKLYGKPLFFSLDPHKAPAPAN